MANCIYYKNQFLSVFICSVLCVKETKVICKWNVEVDCGSELLLVLLLAVSIWACCWLLCCCCCSPRQQLCLCDIETISLRLS